MQPKHLFVDIDNVLFDSTCWDRSLHKLLTQFGVVGHYVCHARVWNLDYLPAVHRGQRDYWQSLEGYLKSLGLTSGQATEMIACSRAKRASIVESKRVFPEARTGLFRLSSAMKVTLIGNSLLTGNELAGYLRKRGLCESMFGFCTSQDLGQTLSEGQFWQDLLRQSGQNEARDAVFASNNPVALSVAEESGVYSLGVGLPESSEFPTRFERFEHVASRLSTQSATSRLVA